MNRVMSSRLLPSVDESADRRHRAGWSMGELLTASGRVVTGTKGERDSIR
jgi:hypothetical protein